MTIVWVIIMQERTVQLKMLSVIPVEKRGHYKKACRSKHIRQVTAYTDKVREATDQELFLGVIESPNQETAWESKVFIYNKKVSIKLEFGADVTVLSEKLYES